MIVPYRHTADLPGLSREEQCEMMALTGHCVRALAEAFRPEGFNIGMNLGRTAGAGIADHLHMHVVPRWNGDTNFMSVVGETRVLPEDKRLERADFRGTHSNNLMKLDC